MVKGISRQVIVVPSPDKKLFEQAIFILKDDAVSQGITDETLLRQAHQVLRTAPERKKTRALLRLIWAGVGAGVMAVVWAVTAVVG